jgi:integrase
MAQQPKRRRTRGAAWYWQQTDSWYFTRPGTKQRVPLLDESGKRIRGRDSKKQAELALARVKVARQWRPTPEPTDNEEWLVAKVCSNFIQDVKRRAANGSVVEEYRDGVVRYLNLLSEYCGALPVSQLQKGHIQHWIESHDSWRSPVTRRNAITIVQAAFNHAADEHGVRNPLKGLKKPPARPRLHSLDDEDEAAIYGATDEPYANFLFAAVRTGLRPFCELAKLTAGDIEETPHGMMWRVFSTKTKKTRKIPIRTDVADLTRNLIGIRPKSSAVVFCNTQGNPWKKVTGVHRFLKIKRNLDWESDPVRSKYSTYSCRHTFAHRMLAGYWNNGVGCSIETLAELMGDTPKTAFDHYGREWSKSYQEPLWAAIGIG